MLKVDEEALRERVLSAWDNTKPEHADDEAFKLMQRARKLSAELTVFSTQEVERQEHIMQAIIDIGEVLGNTLFHVCERVGASPETEAEMGMDGPHAAIHALVDSLSNTLHAHYEDHRSGAAERTETVEVFEIPTKDVGDA